MEPTVKLSVATLEAGHVYALRGVGNSSDTVRGMVPGIFLGRMERVSRTACWNGEENCKRVKRLMFSVPRYGAGRSLDADLNPLPPNTKADVEWQAVEIPSANRIWGDWTTFFERFRALDWNARLAHYREEEAIRAEVDAALSALGIPRLIAHRDRDFDGKPSVTESDRLTIRRHYLRSPGPSTYAYGDIDQAEVRLTVSELARIVARIQAVRA